MSKASQKGPVEVPEVPEAPEAPPDPQALQPPPPPPMSANPPRILIIGAGSRGRTYAEATAKSSNGVVAAVAEIDPYKRAQLGQRWIWGTSTNKQPSEGQSFGDWREFVAYEQRRRQREAAGEPGVPPGVDAAFVCVLDEMHRDVVVALATELGGLHIMCEKPLATTLADCVDMYAALQAGRGQQIVSIGHVLRYSPHNVLLRRLLLQDRVIGDVLSVVHTEPVGWWHFTHSYVRGNWRRTTATAPSLLTKSCHDLDVLLWLLCSPADPADLHARPHLPATVTSRGRRQLFRQSRKPVGAGAATNCLSCAVEPACQYSARRIYLGDSLRGLATGNRGWPVSIVVPDIEEAPTPAAAEAKLVQRLAEDYGPETPDAEVAGRNWFGRCVFESDNDVNDDQVVVVEWDEDPAGSGSGPDAKSGSGSGSESGSGTEDRLHYRGAKTATFHMVAHTTKICDRYTHLYGVHGEIYADQTAITVEDFRDGSVTVHHPRVESLGHGGGDAGLTRQFILAVDRVKNHGWPAPRAQHEIVGCTLDEILRSHALVFAAEDARHGRTVVDWDAWWAREVEARLKGAGSGTC